MKDAASQQTKTLATKSPTAPYQPPPPSATTSSTPPNGSFPTPPSSPPPTPTNQVQVEIGSHDLDFTMDATSDVALLKQRLESVSKKRKELQQLEIQLRAQIIARTQTAQNNNNNTSPFQTPEPHKAVSEVEQSMPVLAPHTTSLSTTNTIFKVQPTLSAQIGMTLNHNTFDLQSREPENAVSEVEQPMPRPTPLHSAWDTTTPFTTNMIFKDRETLISWCKDVGRKNGVVIMIYKSDNAGIGRRPRISLACERSGTIQMKRNMTTMNLTEREIGGKILKTTGSKKCDCPFRLKGKCNEGDLWQLLVLCGTHNHPPGKDIVGHSYAGRLTRDEEKLVRDLYSSGVKARGILATLKEKYPNNVSTIETIYNFRAKHREVRSQKQHKGHPDIKSTYLQEPFEKLILGGRTCKKRALTQGNCNIKKDPCSVEYSETVKEQHSGSSTNVSLHDQDMPDWWTDLWELDPKIRDFIESWSDVTNDGHCGYRAVAELLGLSAETGWIAVRKALVKELATYPDDYTSLLGGIEKYDETEKKLNYDEGLANSGHWMIVPDMGLLIASAFNCVFVSIAPSSCVSYFPLRTAPLSSVNKIVSVANIRGGTNFLKLYLQKDAPIPPVARFWSSTRTSAAAPWQTLYQGRIDEWCLCVKNPTIATF